MKQCQVCHKTYDDSWEVCLNDRSTLVSVDSNISMEKVIRFQLPKGLKNYAQWVMWFSLFKVIFYLINYSHALEFQYLYVWCMIFNLSATIVTVNVLMLRAWARKALILIAIIAMLDQVFLPIMILSGADPINASVMIFYRVFSVVVCIAFNSSLIYYFKTAYRAKSSHR
jgi:hypothetical protein